MNARLVRRLIGLYPPAWRARYGEEFQDFLEAHSSNFPTILNVVRWATYERSLSLVNFKMEPRQHSVTLMVRIAGPQGAGVQSSARAGETATAVMAPSNNAIRTGWQTMPSPLLR